MAITLTESAAKHVARYLERRGKGIGLRLGVKTTGCSGLAYKLEYADDAAPEDVAFESHGVQVLVDPRSLAYIDGTELDFVREGLNEGFRFNNPNDPADHFDVESIVEMMALLVILVMVVVHLIFILISLLLLLM